MHEDKYLYQAAQQAMDPPRKSPASDQWIDRLTLDGYPIHKILQSILVRYREDGMAFHRYIERRAASLRACKLRAKNFVPRLPLTMEAREIVPLLMDKYRISADGAQLLLQDYHWLYLEESQLCIYLNHRGMTILRHKQHKTSTALFFCSEQMRNNYHRFGDTVCLQYSPITLHNSPHTYEAGIFTGQDTNLHPVLFGVSLIVIDGRDRQDTYRVGVRQFLKAMGVRRFPRAFVVGGCEGLYQAVQGLAQGKCGQRFGVFVGWHCLMDKMTLLYTAHPQRDSIIQKFGNILSSLNPTQLHQHTTQLLHTLPAPQTLPTPLTQHSQSLLPHNIPTFIGFGIEKQHFSTLHKLMQGYLKEAEGVGFVCQAGLRMEELLLERVRRGWEFMDVGEIGGMGVEVGVGLRELAGKMERKVFKKLLIMYRSATKYAKILAVSPDQLSYQIALKPHSLPQPTFIYTVRYSLSSGCWYCNCRFIYASGLPCAHLIKIIRKFRGSLAYYINTRWMIGGAGGIWGSGEVEEDSGRDVVSQVEEQYIPATIQTLIQPTQHLPKSTQNKRTKPTGIKSIPIHSIRPCHPPEQVKLQQP